MMCIMLIKLFAELAETGSHSSGDSVDMKKSNHISSECIKVEYSTNTIDDWQQDMILPPRYPAPADYDELRYPLKVCLSTS